MSGSHCDLGACIMGLTQRSSSETVIGIGTVRAWWSFTGDSPPVVLLPSRRGIPSRCAADFTYVPMACGFGYTAFVVDAYAGLIAGWECSLRKDTGFVERALRHAAAYRARQGHPLDDAIHHSDAGSHYAAIDYSETLMLEGLIPSVGTPSATP